MLVEKQFTAKDEADLTREIFIDFYKEFIETGEISDFENICYFTFNPKAKEFTRQKEPLRLENPFIVTKEISDAAVIYGKAKAINVAQKNSELLLKTINPEENDYKKWARNYCVQQYFKKNKIEKIIENIKPELYVVTR